MSTSSYPDFVTSYDTRSENDVSLFYQFTWGTYIAETALDIKNMI